MTWNRKWRFAASALAMRRHDQNRFKPPVPSPAATGPSAGAALLKGAFPEIKCACTQGRPCRHCHACLSHAMPAPAEAQQQQQRGERVKDAVAERLHFAAAVDKYRVALQHPLSEDDMADAAMGLVRDTQRPVFLLSLCVRVDKSVSALSLALATYFLSSTRTDSHVSCFHVFASRARVSRNGQRRT